MEEWVDKVVRKSLSEVMMSKQGLNSGSWPCKDQGEIFDLRSTIAETQGWGKKRL